MNKYFRGFRIQRNVISALIYRELKTRISEVQFGVVGVFIEPLGVMSVFLIIFTIIRELRGIRGILDVELFLVSGIVLFTLFNEIAIRSLNALQANEALFFYRPVKPIDTVIARSVVETGLYSLVLIVITGGIFLYKEKWVLDNFALTAITFLSLSLCAMGTGISFMVAGHRYPFLNQLIPIVLRPFWFVSGVFYSLSSIPQWLRPLVSWNPILQAIELTRHSFNSNYFISNSISLNYLMTCGIVSFTFGLWIYLNNEKILQTK